jgi:hypothetical protein
MKAAARSSDRLEASGCSEMVDYLNDLGIGILFAIAVDGTLRGARGDWRGERPSAA